MLQNSRRGVVRVVALSVAPFLILFAPFLSYLQYQHYGFGHPEVAVSVLVLAGIAVLVGACSALWVPFEVAGLAGLLTFLVDIQARELGLKKLGLLFLGLCAVLWLLRRHASSIVTAMMLTLVVSLVVFPVRFEGAPVRVQGARAGRADLPLVLHVILDEYMGVEAMPAGMAPAGFRRGLRSFFVERGFRLFGHAYSEYASTEWSVPQVLNLSPGRYQPDLTVPGPSPGTLRLTRNAYFQHMAALGYAIRAHEADYLYVCPEGGPASCRTYPTRFLDVLNRLNISLAEKLTVVAGTYLGQSEVYARTREKYRVIRQRLAGKLSLPAWEWERGLPPSPGSMPMFEAVAADLSTAKRGTLVFAHILMPHYPYVYDATCRQRPVSQWMDRSDPRGADFAIGINNGPESRAARYVAYLQQVTCTDRKMDELLDAIPPPLRRDAIVIVHGDHGSRITLVDPTTPAVRPPSASDMTDSFSTLFAVRSPWIAAGYDLETASIACLLRSLSESDFHSTASAPSCSLPNTVYFAAGGKPPVPHPFAPFGTPTSAGVAAATGAPVGTSGLAGPSRQ